MTEALCNVMHRLLKSFDPSNAVELRLFKDVRDNNLERVERALRRDSDNLLKISTMAVMYKNEQVFKLALAHSTTVEEKNFMIESVISQNPFSIGPYINHINHVAECARLAVVMTNFDALKHLLQRLPLSEFDELIRVSRTNKAVPLYHYIEKIRQQRLPVESRLLMQQLRLLWLKRDLENLMVLCDV